MLCVSYTAFLSLAYFTLLIIEKEIKMKIDLGDLLYWLFIVFVLLFVPGGWWMIPLGMFGYLVFEGFKKLIRNVKK